MMDILESSVIFNSIMHALDMYYHFVFDSFMNMKMISYGKSYVSSLPKLSV